MTLNTTRFMLILFSSLLSLNVYSAGRNYKIELIVFAQNMSSSEAFTQTSSRIQWPTSVANQQVYHQVAPEHRRLSGSYRKLANTQGYKPLIHLAWTQRVRANSLSTAVKINDPSGAVNGFIRIQRGNLLHVIADIEYSPSSVIYRLAEKRRLKLNETHYFDHPKFGLLVKISPLG